MLVESCWWNHVGGIMLVELCWSNAMEKLCGETVLVNVCHCKGVLVFWLLWDGVFVMTFILHEW